MKKQLLVLAITSLLVSAWIHPAKSTSIGEALSSCLPTLQNAQFKEMGRTVYQGVMYLLIRVDSDQAPWFTVPELKDGQCINHYTSNEANLKLYKSPKPVATQFEPIIEKDFMERWEQQQRYIKRVADEMGVPPESFGFD